MTWGYLPGKRVVSRSLTFPWLSVVVWLEPGKQKGKVAFTFPLRDADLYTAPPGRLERPRTAPEAAALSAELRGLGTIAF